MLNTKKTLNIRSLIILALLFNSQLFALLNEDFDITTGPVSFSFTHAGYSDGFFWGNSDRHSHSGVYSGRHEMLCGEWAAALYWDQIGGSDPNWLTDEFEAPDFSTGTIFESVSYSSWNDPNNDINDIDTAQAIISDTDPCTVKITIDFELVDLGEQDANGAGGSPMTFKEANSVEHLVYSERYICLQTYTIKNISGSTITGLEFYQMLHGHPADDYGTCYTSYTTTSKIDPLAEYVPYNSVHCAPDSNYAGNFRYDITQWNPGEWDQSGHVDWIGFSSTIAPDAVDCNTFTGKDTGTYGHIENRNLNGETYCEGQVAGAMKWNLGTLENQATKKITVAVMFGAPPVDAAPTSPVDFEKITEVTGCVEPYHYYEPGLEVGVIDYTLTYDMNTWSDPCVYIIDELPDAVDFNSCIGDDWNYYDVNHTVIWRLNSLDANETGSVTLTVHVNEQAEPGGTIENDAVIYGDTFIKSAGVSTCVQCWAGNVIYVDDDVNDGDGLSWQTAISDLNEAMTKVHNDSCYDTIWVAAGTYKPVGNTNGNWQEKSFELYDGLVIFGHFAGDEDDISQRDLNDANNATILQGLIQTNKKVKDVVTGDSVTDVILDGLTIASANDYGIELTSDSNVNIVNCNLTENSDYGIYITTGSTVLAQNCTIEKNGFRGICALGSNMSFVNCNFFSNTNYGLDASLCKVDAVNCTFDGNYVSSGGIYAQNNSEIAIENCFFTNHIYSSIRTSGSSTELVVTDSNFTEATYGSGCIYVAGSADATITGSRIANSNGSNGGHGIYASSADTIIVESSTIENCYNYGINFANSNSLTVNDSIIRNNRGYGVYFSGSSYSLTLDRCLIYANGHGRYERGMYISGSGSAAVTNCWIYDNYNSGIYLSSSAAVNLQNNTIYENNEGSSKGIYLSSGTPVITNCIVWGHDTELYNCSATYSCIQDGSGGTNIASDPCFVDAGADNFHLSPNSLCIDAGNPNLNYDDETDFNGENRVIDIPGIGNGVKDVDMGADEYYWPDADYDRDEIVHFIDYATLAKAWQTSFGDANYNETCDINDNNTIDELDLNALCQDWLWKAPWADEGWMMYMGSSGAGLDGLESAELMLLDTEAILAARSETLTPRNRGLCDIDASAFIDDERIDEILDWLAELWESGQLDEIMTEQEFIDFYQSVEAFK